MLQGQEQSYRHKGANPMKKVTTLTLAAAVAFGVLNVNIANAKISGNIIETLKTSQKEAIQDPYFQIKKVKVKELSNEEALEFNDDKSIALTTKNFNGPGIPPIPPNGIPGGLVATTPGTEPQPSARGVFEGIIMVVDKLIAIGQKIIPTIKDGKSVVNNNPMASVSVLPRSEAKDPVVHDMGGWSVPVSKHYKIVYENAYGMEVVNFVYSISFQYGGSVDGKGKYLAGIRASARNIVISWGFDLDASSQLLQISNVGTQQNVIAAATLEMNYTVKNWTRNITTSNSFHVTGDGKLYKLD